MAISDIPIFSMLRTKMEWHQERQRVLAENVANADTPKFQPSDLTPPDFDETNRRMLPLTLARTDAGHIIGGAGSGNSGRFDSRHPGGAEVRPAGNSVSLEDEMIKVAGNQMDYQAATALYTRGVNLIKTALGKR